MYGRKFAAVAASSGIQELRSPIRAPKANVVCERIIGSLKRECRQAISIEMACRSYAHLPSLSGTSVSQGIRHILQSSATSPGDLSTDTGALYAASTVKSNLFSFEGYFQTGPGWAAPPLPLYTPVELNLPVQTGVFKCASHQLTADGLV